MKYRVTTIERDATGNVYRCPRPYFARSSLSAVVRQTIARGFVPGATSGTGLTILEVEFTGEHS